MFNRLQREEIYKPAIQDQIDNEPLSLEEQMAGIMESAKKLEKMAKENADQFRDMFSSAEKLSKAIGLK